MTWREVVAEATTLLRKAGVDDPALNAKYIALFVVGKWGMSELQGYLNDNVSPSDLSQFRALIERRMAGEPVQYIVGETEFYGLRLYCSPAALIPRPETELLVEQAIAEARSWLDSKPSVRILDIGTGTGAIALAVAAHVPAAHLLAIDSSAEAVELASRNLDRLADSRTRILHLDVFDPAILELGKFDLILSNPPYISTAEFELLPLEVHDFEPRIALTDEEDGLKFYRRIAELGLTMLEPTGAVVVELSFDGAARAAQLFESLGYRDLTVSSDLAGIDRILTARL